MIWLCLWACAGAPVPVDEVPPAAPSPTAGSPTAGLPSAEPDGPEPPPEKPPPPAYTSTIAPIPQQMRADMTGVTWAEGCPVGLDALALLTVAHWDMDGAPAEGQLVVAAEHAEAVDRVFGKLFAAEFRITRIAPAHRFGGDDDQLMANDITSAFNCRKKTGGSSYSEHSYGHALDLNPLRNPYVKGQRVLPPEGRRFADRSLGEPGMIAADGPVVAAFRDIGWRWGGHWRSVKDYQHFSATGR